jgi:protein TonB
MRRGRRLFGSFGLSLLIHGGIVVGLGAITWRAVRSERAAPTVVGMLVEPPERLAPEPEEPPLEVEEPLIEDLEEPVLVETEPVPEPEPPEEPPLEDPVPLLPFEHRDWVLTVPTPEAPEETREELAAEPAVSPTTDEPAEVAPVLISAPPPPYPALSIRRGEEGQVTCRMHLSETGDVVRVELVESSGHGRLDEAALEALASWRFRPAMRGGVPRSTTVLHPVVFRIR